MRLSRYNEIIQIDDERYLLFNTATCAADIVSGEVVRLLRALPLSPAEREALPPRAVELLQSLSARGYITERSAHEEVAALREAFEEIRDKRLSRRLHGIVVTYDCNMRCTYCFQQTLQGRSDPARSRPATLNREMVDRIFELVEGNRSPRDSAHRRPIGLYGGEPLMRQNYPLVEYILQQGEAHGHSFVIFTNGFDLVEFMPLLQRYPVRNIHVTLDGVQEVHDALRPGRNGAPTHERIVRGIEAAREAGFRITMRVNVDAQGARLLPRFWDFLRSKGWDQDPNLLVVVSEIRQSNGCLSCRPQGSNPAAKRVQEVARRPTWHQRPSRASLLLTTVLSRILTGQKPVGFPRYWFCNAHQGLRLYGPDGYIYLCWGLVGSEHARLARYWPDVTPEDKAVLDHWEGRHVFALGRCRNCKYLLLCGGGCAVEALHSGQTLMESSCWDFGGFLRHYVPLWFRHDPVGGTWEARRERQSEALGASQRPKAMAATGKRGAGP